MKIKLNKIYGKCLIIDFMGIDLKNYDLYVCLGNFYK